MESIGKEGFHWRGRAKNDSTSIHMWIHPFIFPRYSSSSTTNGEKLTVILVDSRQGVFEYETAIELTASIFGLDTLLISYQIYNVDKIIHEDNLIQLALLSEYGRMALLGNDTKENNGQYQPRLCGF